MTNKVKPFYIRITDDMTPQMVQDAFDKCHNLGVRASNNDDIKNLFDWLYFGVCSEDGTYLSNSKHGYFDAQEITLGQLDEWLGLEVKEEWKNGDECVWLANNQEFKFVSLHCENKEIAIVWNGANDYRHCKLSDLRKPETPEQKAERERLEAAERLHDIAQDAYFANEGGSDGSATWNRAPDRVKNMYLAIVDETNYRKQ